MTYWAKRWERLKLDAMDRADLTIDELEQIYYESLMKLQADVESWYHRYARENHLTLSEARKQLNARELKAFKITLKEYQEQAQRANLSDAHKRMLANASIRVRLDRAQQLYIQVVHHTSMLAQGKNERMEKLLADVYESNTYKTAYETQTMKSVYKDVDLVPEDAIRTAISKPWAPDGVDFSARIWKDRDVLVNSLQSEITRSLIIGEGSGKLAERIANKYNVSFKNARRLAETETAYVQELSSYEQYKDNDIEQYQILATLDSRTSETCRHLDGKIIDMKDYKIGVTAPPFHCHCRTTTIPYIEGITDDGGRAYRDENGKTAYTDEYMTYEEWYNKYVKPKTIPTGKGTHEFNEDGTIKPTIEVSKDERYKVKVKARPNEVIKYWSKFEKGNKQLNLTLYDEHGFMYKQLHYGHHGFPKKHAFSDAEGIEKYYHTHEIKYDENHKVDNENSSVSAMTEEERGYIK